MLLILRENSEVKEETKENDAVKINHTRTPTDVRSASAGRGGLS